MVTHFLLFQLLTDYNFNASKGYNRKEGLLALNWNLFINTDIGKKNPLNTEKFLLQ